ncbi:MAG: septal ring lytic transglycosylase RlpA family protein, partial [Treponema sp.]|nr:septal ring lytic transglycosylase RlpA family protein [Treponema sp.]
MKRTTLLFSLGLTVFLLCVPEAAKAQSPQPAGEQIFRQEGIASWYGPEFDGRPTASGEIFNSGAFTAAHPSLPFGTVLTITNRHNNKQVTVRVNDRGPFVSARIIDLSRAAAEQLDMIATGTAPVTVESVAGVPAAAAPAAALPPQTTPRTAVREAAPVSQTASVPADQSRTETVRPAAELKSAAPLTHDGAYRLQVGSYKIARNAVDAFEKL